MIRFANFLKTEDIIGNYIYIEVNIICLVTSSSFCKGDKRA